MKKSLMVLFSLVLCLSIALTACSKKDDAKEDDKQGGEDVVKKDVKLEMVTIGPVFFDRPQSNDQWLWKTYEEMTGVSVDFTEVPVGQQKAELLISTGELPDAFLANPFSAEDLFRYGSTGVFIPLEDLIAEHAPNVTAMFNEHPDIKKSLTMPDGHIYSLPGVEFDRAASSFRLYINKTWLDNLGLQVPDTIDEYYDALEAFKEKDANGNGDPDDEIPYAMASGLVGVSYERTLLGAFGMGNGGHHAAQQMLYIDKNGELQLTINDPKEKELWAFLRKLYANGLMNETAFSGLEKEQYLNIANNGVIGSFVWVNPSYVPNSVQKDFVGINALKGPYGDQVMSYIDSPVRSLIGFEITNKNKFPAETMKWIDYFYGEEGSMFARFGKEGVTYNMVDGLPVYIPEILNYKDGVGAGIGQYSTMSGGGVYPTVAPPPEMLYGAQGTSVQEVYQIEDLSTLDKYMPDVIIPVLMGTEEENKKIATIRTDIEGYVEEMRAKFVTGVLDLDKDWDNYVSTLKRMGSDTYLEIKRAAYQRFLDAK